ncbi:hypothetical protein ACTPEF_25270, partial [Clostridioides difficile]
MNFGQNLYQWFLSNAQSLGRLATIENADQILVVDHGKIVQKGTHDQLIQQKGIYRSFINIR